jgi:hypothetical protein
VHVTVCAALILSAASPEQKPATLEVELSPPERAAEVVRVVALDRDVPQKMTGRTVAIRETAAARVEGSPGGWRFAELRPGCYDLLVETRAGKFEGYALRPRESSDAELAGKDRERIAGIFSRLKTFEDHRRILDLGGNGRQAVALVELLRTSATTYSKRAPDSVIWRVECWEFDKLYGAWTKGDARVLRRFMVPRKEFAGWNWCFVRELGGLELAAGQSRKLAWTLPEKFDPATGRAAHAERGPPGAAAEEKRGR